jgi:hypothetical protein
MTASVASSLSTLRRIRFANGQGVVCRMCVEIFGITDDCPEVASMVSPIVS